MGGVLRNVRKEETAAHARHLHARLLWLLDDYQRAVAKVRCHLIHYRNEDEVEECHNVDVWRWILYSSTADSLIFLDLFFS